MATAARALEKNPDPEHKTALDKKMSAGPGRVGMAIAGVALVIGLVYAGGHLLSDLETVHPTSYMPFLLLGVALLTALAFEFVNGFHDTANAVATVIYTHTLEPHVAVVWSGLWNFFGVMVSTGAVAFGIVSLLPVELILQVGGGRDSRWCSRCWWRRSSGTLERGISGCRHRARTH